jgi:hypothetical protein
MMGQHMQHVQHTGAALRVTVRSLCSPRSVQHDACVHVAHIERAHHERKRDPSLR